MMFPRKGLALALAVSSLLFGANARADWAQSTDPLIIKAAPANGDVQVQNPPGLTWARYPTGPASYEVQITPNGGVPVSATVTRNWYLPSKALPPGTYSWRVRPTGSSDWSAARTFQITSRSTTWAVPDNATLRATIAAKAHPRALPSSFTSYSTWSSAKLADLDAYASRMGNEVKSQIVNEINLSDALWPLAISSPLTAAMNSQQADIRNKIDEASRQLEAAALMWRLKKDPVFFNEAIRRGDQLAALSPTGPTSYVNQDQATRQIALSLLKAIDFLAADLDANRKANWLNIVKVRTTEIYNDLSGSNGRLDQYPFDSHGNTALCYLTLISTLALGDIPDAQAWFDFSFRAYALAPNPWSGPEGGYANGTAYGEYAAAILLSVWDPLSAASGINFYAKPWANGFIDFATEFVPVGAKRHAFGDAEETGPDARVWTAFASRMNSPRAAWYITNMNSFEDALTRLQAPYPLPITTVPYKIAPSNSAYFPSIGWAAMHSDMSSSNRISMFFKSSPYGSFNHSHGDQNAIELSIGGTPLLSKAGWYDWYGSPMWTDWYRITRSTNGITFDGGVGQNVAGYRETLQNNGRISAFSATSAYDFVEGDATPAYAGALTMAKRQVWNLRNAGNAMLVRDKLSATVAHTYEWNMNTPVIMTVESPTSVKVVNGTQSVCVRSLNTNVNFAKWTGPAAKSGTVEDHGAFYLKGSANTVNEFLVLVDPGCLRPAVSISTSNGVRTVTVGGQSLTLN
ncbi:alginate lyase [Massilia terrae]|uniref:Heparinase II/III family protein n=1 Tax=Massilia terrae TaxID=1811224 RepID=A0ABT2CYH8_9BURK|nr:heparinase II/III family protein [Massilia terrae]MCS0659034.1 heparinase II/III family protein [Massilia terrae]